MALLSRLRASSSICAAMGSSGLKAKDWTVSPYIMAEGRAGRADISS